MALFTGILEKNAMMGMLSIMMNVETTVASRVAVMEFYKKESNVMTVMVSMMMRVPRSV
jgi:hypothetical protein